MEIDLLRLSLLAIGVLVLLIVYWFNRPRSKSSPPPESSREVDPDEILGIDSPISAVEDPLDSDELRSELESLKRVIHDDDQETVSAPRRVDRGGPGRQAPPEGPGPERETTSAAVPPAPAAREPAEEEPAFELDEKIVVLYLVSRSPDGWSGEDLFAAAESAGLSYGDLKIYHFMREGESQFSMANLVEPGYFEPGQAAGFSSPGVTFFLQLPGPARPLRAFDDMVGVITHMAERLDGEPRDSDRRPVGAQGFAALRRDIEVYEPAALTSD